MADDWRAIGAEAARKLTERRYAAAAEGFGHVVALNPGHAESWFNLGYARRHARQYQEALSAYAEALRLGISAPEEVHLNRSAILSEHLHRTDEALSELESAVRLNSGFVTAWLNLGNLYEDLGRPADARKAYQAALRAKPNDGRAIARLAGIDSFEGQPRRAVAALRDAAKSIPRNSVDAAEVSFALGSALDAAGDYPAAFAAIAEGNAISAALRDPSTRYDRSAQEKLVDALIAAFPKRADKQGDADGQSGVIFICGMFRSGSTLAEQLVARHSQITAGGELEFIPAMVAEELQPYPQSVADASASMIDQLREQYIAQLRALHPSTPLVTDKRPDNFMHIGLIKTLFPNAPIVHTVRSPLDNLLSAWFLFFAEGVNYADRLDDLVHYYAQYRRLMAHWESLYGDDIFRVDYDALVSEPRPIMESLLQFLGLPWDDDCLDHRKAGNAVRTASNWQVRRPLHDKSSGRWRNYAKQLQPVREALNRMRLLTG